MTKDTINLLVGAQSKIGYALYPSNTTDTTLTFSSSAPSVATVQQGGLITGVALGSTKITISNSASGVTASCVVNVVPVQATSLSLNKSTLGMVAGQADTLIATFGPANAGSEALVWKSSNTVAATVNANGIIQALSTGTATITASTAGGKLSASCQVTITVVPVTGIKVDSTQFALLTGTSLKMGYIIMPAGSANADVSWSTDNSAVATVQSDGTINGLTVGTAHITAKTFTGGFTSTCTVSVVSLTYFLDIDIFYTTSTANGQLVEGVSFGGFNYALYDVVVSEIDVYNNENNMIGSLKSSSGVPVFTFTHAAGGGLTSPSQSFVVSQVEPGATSLQHWPMIVYFTCDGVNYKMTLTWVNSRTSMVITQL